MYLVKLRHCYPMINWWKPQSSRNSHSLVKLRVGCRMKSTRWLWTLVCYTANLQHAWRHAFERFFHFYIALLGIVLSHWLYANALLFLYYLCDFIVFSCILHCLKDFRDEIERNFEADLSWSSLRQYVTVFSFVDLSVSKAHHIT